MAQDLPVWKENSLIPWWAELLDKSQGPCAVHTPYSAHIILPMLSQWQASDLPAERLLLFISLYCPSAEQSQPQTRIPLCRALTNTEQNDPASDNVRMRRDHSGRSPREQCWSVWLPMGTTPAATYVLLSCLLASWKGRVLRWDLGGGFWGSFAEIYGEVLIGRKAEGAHLTTC